MNDFAQEYKSLASQSMQGEEPHLHAGADFNAKSYLYDSDNRLYVRPEFSRKDYERFRPNETIPEGNTQFEQLQIIKLCTQAYEQVGVIRSVVDMMSEFVAEGIEIVHEDAGPNAFYKTWAKRINLEDRVERFANWFFKGGNVVVRRQFGKVSQQDLNRLKRNKISDKSGTTETMGNIPLNYIFYNPSDVELIGGNIAKFSSVKEYALKVQIHSMDGLSTLSYDRERILAGLPEELQQLFDKEAKDYKGRTFYIPIDPNKVYVAHYKKDDDDIWGKSFIYSILGDVHYNRKVQMAKIATLDNMISSIRLWKLGDHTQEILPAPGLAAKLANVISNHTGAGPIDLIWDSMIELEEFYPPIEKLSDFDENYHPILLGLGIPEALVGGASGATANVAVVTLGLKNLIKRLEAARRAISDWLEHEIDIIQANMGFRKRPYIRFSNADLHDERTYYTLLLQLVDRNIISDERILEIIDEIPQLESLRVKNESSKRESGDKPNKAGPFHNPQLQDQQEHEVEKLKLQSDNLAKQKPPAEIEGRPPGSKDSRQRTRGPNSTPSLAIIEAKNIYDTIYQAISSSYLESNDVPNIRSLTADQKNEIDSFTNMIFASLDPNAKFDLSRATDPTYFSTEKIKEFNDEWQKYSSQKLSVEDARFVKASIYTTIWGIN